MDYKGVLLEVLLKISWRHVIYSSGSGNFNGHICRYCDVPYDATDNPFYHSKLTKAADILINYWSNEELKKFLEWVTLILMRMRYISFNIVTELLD
jgi:hypothetical protein